MSMMKEEIENFKRKNGNENLSVKDLLMYNISRTDQIFDHLREGSSKIATNSANIKSLRRWLISMIPFIISALAWLFVRSK